MVALLNVHQPCEPTPCSSASAVAHGPGAREAPRSARRPRRASRRTSEASPHRQEDPWEGVHAAGPAAGVACGEAVCASAAKPWTRFGSSQTGGLDKARGQKIMEKSRGFDRQASRMNMLTSCYFHPSSPTVCACPSAGVRAFAAKLQTRFWYSLEVQSATLTCALASRRTSATAHTRLGCRRAKNKSLALQGSALSGVSWGQSEQLWFRRGLNLTKFHAKALTPARFFRATETYCITMMDGAR